MAFEYLLCFFLLTSLLPSTFSTQFVANCTVSLDGTATYHTISEAVKDAPSQAMQRYIIHIKSGLYQENVQIPEDKWNITFIGDGIGMTIILSSNKNQKENYGIKVSGALVVGGAGFLGINMTFENTSGPEKGQAVAMRSYADRAIFYQCSFLGYQEFRILCMSILTNSSRECDIYGTVDFIFGDATVVLQDCRIIARKPLQGQSNVITAQGKSYQGETTGIVLRSCIIMPSNELLINNTMETYLGRPWKEFSTTVIMQSDIGALVDSKGWLSWNASNPYITTLTYKEFNNSGPGAYTAERVNWPGYQVISTREEAMEYTVGKFLRMDQWISQLGVPFYSGLL